VTPSQRDAVASVDERDGLAEVAANTAAAASEWLAALRPEQRPAASYPGPGASGGETERQRWFYTPTDHGGLTLNSQSPGQQRLVMKLLAAGLSEPGYVTMSTVMGLENVLDRLESWTIDLARERGRDPGMYFLRIFGDPGDRVWSWRFGGHHISISQLVIDGRVAGCTPLFFGADPACSPLLGGAELRPLSSTQDLATALAQSLDEDQRREMLLHPRAVSDLVGGNRTRVSEGDQRIPLSGLFRDRFRDPDVAAQVDRADQEMERLSGYTVADHQQVALTTAPKGLAALHMSAPQRDLLRLLLHTYFERVAAPLARHHRDRYAADSDLADVHFAWAGAIEPAGPHYYRVQGPRLLIEYDNTQRGANHVHSVWRDPRGDFGLDALAEHRRRFRH
jgi:Protein of unknown function (DUF3500)